MSRFERPVRYCEGCDRYFCGVCHDGDCPVCRTDAPVKPVATPEGAYYEVMRAGKRPTEPCTYCDGELVISSARSGIAVGSVRWACPNVNCRGIGKES